MIYIQTFLAYIKSTVQLIVAHLLNVNLIAGLNPLYLYVFLTIVGLILTLIFSKVFRSR